MTDTTHAPDQAAQDFVPVEDWDDPRHQRGMEGERLALAWLTSAGWCIEAHRFRIGRHDLDLVARRGRLVAFIEVKTRTGTRHGTPAQAVGPRKQATLSRVAECWRQRHGRPGDSYRFDVISVLLHPRGPRVEHIPDAWRLTAGPGMRA